ncbi:MAG: hypothetical protein EOP93_21430, partial [Lysobacteraceae bacterium]
MKRIHATPLATAVALALAFVAVVPAASAQESMREQRAKRLAEVRGETTTTNGKPDAKKAEAQPVSYPDATRKSPEAQTAGKMIKQLQALQELYEKDDMAAALAKGQEIASTSGATAYEKSYAYSVAGNAAASLDDQPKAADFFAKAIAADGLDNNSHFATMYNLAVIQLGEEKYADALVTIDRFLAETRSSKPEHQALRAGVLANLGRNDEAAAIYKDLVARNPGDKRILMNAVATLQGAEKFDQANALLEDAYKRGMLTEARELRSLYIGYMNAERWDDAQRVIEEGSTKGILQPGPDLARDYQVLAQNAYQDDKLPQAIALYQKAAPMAADGEAYLNLAKVLDYAGKKAEAKAAAQKALEK